MMPRCYIGYELDGGDVRAVYVHNNGWPGGGGERWPFAVGQILAGYHNSAAAAAALVALGAMSYIGRTLEPTPPDARDSSITASDAEERQHLDVQLQTTCDYHRWRGDAVAVDAYANRAEYLDDVCADISIAFIYLYAPDVGWLCARNPRRGDAEDGHGFLSLHEASLRFITLDAAERIADARKSIDAARAVYFAPNAPPDAGAALDAAVAAGEVAQEEYEAALDAAEERKAAAIESAVDAGEQSAKSALGF